MKRILEVKWIDEKIVRIKLEATKRRKVWMRVEKISLLDQSCTPTICQLYYKCGRMKSPLKKYKNFESFCNNLFSEYPGLKEILKVKSINDATPIKKKNRISYNIKL